MAIPSIPGKYMYRRVYMTNRNCKRRMCQCLLSQSLALSSWTREEICSFSSHKLMLYTKTISLTSYQNWSGVELQSQDVIAPSTPPVCKLTTKKSIKRSMTCRVDTNTILLLFPASLQCLLRVL